MCSAIPRKTCIFGSSLAHHGWLSLVCYDSLWRQLSNWYMNFWYYSIRAWFESVTMVRDAEIRMQHFRLLRDNFQAHCLWLPIAELRRARCALSRSQYSQNRLMRGAKQLRGWGHRCVIAAKSSKGASRLNCNKVIESLKMNDEYGKWKCFDERSWS